jgi:gluconate 2-dehydrogenase gamma chain
MKRMDRRTFLARSAAAAASLGLAACARDRLPDDRGRLDAAQWRAIEAAQDRLLPSAPGAPGARDVRATAYLDAALAERDTRAAVRDRIRGGAARLDALARARGAADFAALPPAARDAVLADWFDTPEGDRWFDAVMPFTLEALLGDPVHGGNPEGIAWDWLGHRPGWPRPAERRA